MTEQPSVEMLIAQLERDDDLEGQLMDFEFRMHRIAFNNEWPKNLPRYLTSLEAALLLLPDWASYELTRSAAGPPTFTRCRIWDWRRGPTMSDPDNEWKAEGNRPLSRNVCIAALRARQAVPHTDE